MNEVVAPLRDGREQSPSLEAFSPPHRTSPQFAIVVVAEVCKTVGQRRQLAALLSPKEVFVFDRLYLNLPREGAIWLTPPGRKRR